MQDNEKSERKDVMRKLLILIILVLSTLSITILQAQPIGLERRVPLKNIYFGVKCGVNAIGMRYSGKQYSKESQKMEDYSFNNLSTMYQGDITSCFVGGLTVERTLPGFSYGLEGVILGLDAQARKQASPAQQDSAFLIDIRIPLRIRFLEDYTCSPYIFIAPTVGTYLYVSEKVELLENGGERVVRRAINGQSIWNETPIEWGTNNTRTYHYGVLAGIGMDVKIPIDNYEAKFRVECGWNQGLNNLMPKKSNITRKLNGLEATIGISFPLMDNPSYSWMM